jgi:hypothetical protein
MFVIPADGLLVPNPEAPRGGPRHLPPEGAEVPDTAYWRRRLADGEVREGEAPKPPAAPEPPVKPSKGKE